MIDRQHPLPVVQQCQLLALARSSVYAVPQPVSAATSVLMRQLDELHNGGRRCRNNLPNSRMPRSLLHMQE